MAADGVTLQGQIGETGAPRGCAVTCHQALFSVSQVPATLLARPFLPANPAKAPQLS
jgi:hypothetical protein